MPLEVTQDLHAKPVSTDGVKELQYLQENLPGVVADVCRMKREGRRPSAKQQLRQECAELRLFCRRWDSLWIRSIGLLTMFVAATLGLPAGEKIVTPTVIRQKLVWDTHKQALAGAQGVLTKLQLWWYWPYMESEI